MEYMINGAMKAEGTFLLFGGFCLAGTFFVAIFVKETLGLNDSQKKSLYRKQWTKMSEVEISKV
jgi:hypothetical protein